MYSIVSVKNKIKELRASMPRRTGESMSQGDLADRLTELTGQNMSRSAISRLENNETQFIDVTVQAALVVALHLDSIDELYAIEVSEEGQETAILMTA